MGTDLVEHGYPLAGTETNRPTTADHGCQYFNETTQALEVYDENVTAWLPVGVQSRELTFTETANAGVWTGTVTLPAGSTLHDIIINGVALWDSETSATLKAGDETDDDGFFTGVNLKATDLLAGESISFALAGGKAGAYIANSQVSPRYYAAAEDISVIVTKVGDTGTAGRTRATIVFSVGSATAATKVDS